jgi:uncharacterized phage-associated protein
VALFLISLIVMTLFVGLSYSSLQERVYKKRLTKKKDLSNVPECECRHLVKYIKKWCRKNGVESGEVKTQRLLYLSNEMSLITSGKPIINEMFAAWPLGPVCRSLFYEQHIGSLETDVRPSDYETEILELTLNIWGKHDSETIRKLINDYSPWKEFYVEGVDGILIPNQCIKENAENFYNEIFKNKI